MSIEGNRGIVKCDGTFVVRSSKLFGAEAWDGVLWRRPSAGVPAWCGESNVC